MYLIYVEEWALGDMIVQLHVGDSVRLEVQEPAPDDRRYLTTIMGAVGERVTPPAGLDFPT
jgi:hypothetical protein